MSVRKTTLAECIGMFDAWVIAIALMAFDSAGVLGLERTFLFLIGWIACAIVYKTFDV
jgi:hypothetical protein